MIVNDLLRSHLLDITTRTNSATIRMILFQWSYSWYADGNYIDVTNAIIVTNHVA